ncbi:kinase-like protein, partial [Auriscalpium vulgare]
MSSILKDNNLIGLVLMKRYQFVEILGSGAFGVVYRAKDIVATKGTQYAIKCMPRYPACSPEAQAQEREWYMQSLVDDHPNVVSLHEIHTVDKYVFLVFDLCPSGDLFSAITERKVFYQNDDLIKLAFVQIIDALAHCHSKGVAHRDLKPENILASEDGTSIFLSDFGLATEDIELPPSHRAGSGHYMSPECLGIDIRLPSFSTQTADVWALGVILVNMLTGRTLWKRAIVDDEFFEHFLHDKRCLIDQFDISEEANTLLRRIFDMNPFTRPSLDSIRAEVLAISTFYLTDDEIDPHWEEAFSEQAFLGSPERSDISLSPSFGRMYSPDEEYLFASPADLDRSFWRFRRPKNQSTSPISWSP